MPEAIAQFVLLRHTLSDRAHWDLMFDVGPALATWQLLDDPAGLADTATCPPTQHGHATPLAGEATDETVIRAQRIGDHRRAYLEYEGPVSGNRGHVTRVDAGRYELLERRLDVWRVRLDGRLLRGEFHLMKNPDESWGLRRFSGS